MAAAAVSIDVSQWEQRGGAVLQYTASNGRIRRTFVAPSGEKFRTWKECLKYMEETTVEDNSTSPTGKKASPMQCSDKASKKRAREKSCEQEELASSDSEDEEEPNCEQAPRRMPKRAAAASNLKERRIVLSNKDSLVEVKRERVVDGEDIALLMTAESGEGQPPQRRLLDFIVHDVDGNAQPIELVGVMPLYLTTAIIPQNGTPDKDKGVRCEGFGPLESWSISGYEDGQPVLWVCTDLAEYACLKPAGVYKKQYDMLYEKAVVCIEAYRALSKPDGGDPYLDLDELIVRVSRALLSNKKNFKAHIFVREFMLAHGTFIVDQLTALDGNASQDEQLFNGLPALIALESESKNICLISQSTKGTALRIEERGAASNVFTSISNDQTSADTDEKLARLLQEQENRKASGRRNGRSQNGKGKYYIRINEDEIAGDYPLPAFYKANEEEMDEYVLFDDDTSTLAPEDLPRRMLHDWALYNSDSRLVSLELLPMLCGAETDTDIFGSGIMTEDDGSGYCLDQDMDFQVGNVGGTGSSSSPKATCLSSEDSSKRKHPEGIRIFLSAVKEWMIEFGASMLFVSIRTDGAWYRLGQPSSQYAKWYTPVIKTAKLAIKIITMLKEETRASKLSFLDVTKKLAEQQEDEPTFISSKLLEVQRYVVVHGQIILQQFAEYPDENIKKSAFITGLTSKMEEKHHAKLTFSKKKILLGKGRNLNPRASLRPDGTKPKPMRATTTRLVNRIWSEYYAFSEVDTKDIQQTTALNKDVDAEEDEEEVEDESDAEEETVLAAGDSNELMGKMKSFKNKCSNKVEWLGKSVGITKANELVYKRALVGSEEVNVGGVVLVALEEQAEALSLLLVEFLYERKSGSHCCHGRILDRGSQTVLGNAASMQEVFLTSKCADVLLSNIRGTVMVDFRKCTWGHAHRKAAFAQNEADRARAKELEKEGLPMEYYCRFVYHPEEGAFFVLPNDILPSGSGICKTCQEREELKQREEMQVFPDREGFRLQGVEYYLNDFLYLAPETFPPISSEIEQLEKFKASRNKGLRAFAVCQLLEIKLNNLSRKSNPNLVQLIVRRFFRPEDISPQKAYMADVREVYYSEETDTVGIQAVRGKCEVMKQLQIDGTETTESLKNVFFCNCIFDLKKGTVKQLPANIRLNSSRMLKGKSSSDEFINAKKKGKAPESVEAECESTSLSGRLATLDIFAGCGGLSEGLHQSGVSFTKWAIEYEKVAAEAFQLNHPQASVFCENCNVILRCIMEKGGDLDDCISTTEAEELSRKVNDEEKCKLPAQGEVDFISGGPPCQGFSGMNRFNQRAWSKVQCEMILSFLSYVDYFRPRFFLLENVRNLISFNKGQTFRLTLASLLEMGYQVRFGVLQAGNYGVSQSRKRAFIWAASPEETLPEWPEPRHVFASSQLKILLPGGLQYAAVSDAADGAPLRPITVRDTIGDLPPVSNGATKIELAYDKPPESWFQKFIRGRETILYDHVSKEMNELNYIRCQRIPKRPGADWRDLPEEKVKLSTGQLVDLIPWCLPNTAERHNQWKGLFGRLDWDGNFPTSVTDPQPMGKVGMCFHPEQDRIVTVRECARSQGFPDGYKFCGNIQSKHRQIGNAVPPPLARALGEKLKVVLGLKNCQP